MSTGPPGFSRSAGGYSRAVTTDLIDRLAATRTVTITTTGRRSGLPRRTEIWWFRFEGRFIITGTPGPRDWMANLEADSRLTVHAFDREFPGTSRPVTDLAFRRRFFSQEGNPEIAWYVSEAPLDALVTEGPMIEVLF